MQEIRDGAAARIPAALLFVSGILLFIIVIYRSGLSLTGTAVLWALGVGLLLFLDRLWGSAFAERRILQLSVIVILSSAFAYYLFGMNLEAKFWVLDDHQIMTYLGEDGKMTLAEAPGKLMETEVGQIGAYPRFRPTYYVLRILEAWLWGKNASLWYMSRLLMAALFISIGWYVLARLIGFLPSALTVAFIFTWPFWGDIFSRLGPGETYATVGLALFFLGSYAIVIEKPQAGPGNRRAYLGWLSVAAGCVLAVGSKENFMILLPLVLLLLFSALRRRQIPGFAIAVSLLVFAYAGFIAWAVLLSVSRLGTDQYARPVAFGDRLIMAWDGVRAVESIAILILVAGLLIFLFWTYRSTARKPLRRTAWIVLAVAGATYLLLYLSQYIFYAGEWPSGIRYDFPGLLYRPILFLTAVWFILAAARQRGVSSSLSGGLKAGLMVGAALLIGTVTFNGVREVGFLNVEQTRNFGIDLDNVTRALRSDPDSALVLESHFVGDYETITSWGRFLRADGIRNPIFLRMHGYSSVSVETPLQKILAVQLEKASLNGERELSPLDNLSSYEDKCYSLQISGRTPTSCEDLN